MEMEGERQGKEIGEVKIFKPLHFMPPPTYSAARGIMFSGCL